MKDFSFILIPTFAIILSMKLAYAFDPDLKSPSFQKNECYWSIPFNCIINQKIDKRHLGLVCSPLPLGWGIREHAVLQINHDWSSRGSTNALTQGFKYLGSEKVELENGFEVPIDIFKQCTPPLCQDRSFQADHRKCQ